MHLHMATTFPLLQVDMEAVVMAVAVAMVAVAGETLLMLSRRRTCT